MFNSTFSLATRINSVNEHVVLLTSLLMHSTLVTNTGTQYIEDFGNKMRNDLLTLLHTTFDDLSFTYKALKDGHIFARSVYEHTATLITRYNDWRDWFTNIKVKDDTPQDTATAAIRGLLALIMSAISDIQSLVVAEFM